MPRPDEFITAARCYSGVRWLHQGRSRMGLDCVGLIVVGLADIGVEVPDLTGYRRDPDPDKFVGHIRSVTDPAPNGIVTGAIGIFRGQVQPCHVGIFAELYGQRSLLHAYAGASRQVVEEPFIHDWPYQLMEVRLLRGLDY